MYEIFIGEAMNFLCLELIVCHFYIINFPRHFIFNNILSSSLNNIFSIYDLMKQDLLFAYM